MHKYVNTREGEPAWGVVGAHGAAVPEMHASALPPMVGGMQDGVTVLLDYRRARNTAVKAPCDFLHGESEDQGSRNTGRGRKECATVGAEAPPPIASVFVTMEHATVLSRDIVSHGASSVNVPMHTSNGAYSHCKLEGKRVESSEYGKGETRAEVTISFVPATMDGGERMQLEEGEIPAAPMRPVVRSYLVVIRPHASFMLENHDPHETMYVHGMRKAVSYVAWGLCECPPCNQDVPIVPPGITVEECALVIRSMRIEVGVPSTDTCVGALDIEAADGEMQGGGYMPLYSSFRKATAEDGSGVLGAMQVAEVPIIEREDTVGVGLGAVGAERAAPARQSIYPVGILASRCVQCRCACVL